MSASAKRSLRKWEGVLVNGTLRLRRGLAEGESQKCGSGASVL
jgi:hypothetical protein